MKALVALILLVSVGLILIVTIGGWSELEGMKPLNFFWCIAYLIIAFYVFVRWSRGMLPIAAGLGILLLMVALVAGIGLSGTSWFDRSHAGFASAHSLLGGKGLSADTLGGDGVARPRPDTPHPVCAERVRSGLERRAGSPHRGGSQARLQPTRPSPWSPSDRVARAREAQRPTATTQGNSAAGGTRTHTSRRTVPFEGTASADCATAALGGSLVAASSPPTVPRASPRDRGRATVLTRRSAP